VVQSAFKSFFVGQTEGKFQLENWDSLWAMLTVITVRKCGRRLSHFRAACRDLRREVEVAADKEGHVTWEAPGLDPTPAEAAIWAETLAQILGEIKERERPIVQMRLQGYGIAEIAAAVGRSERTVLRVLEGVRTFIEQMNPEDEPVE
jgi:RNA polymerase sigma-70 factor, ECF subfamily